MLIKNDAQLQGCELSFIWGKMRTTAQEAAPRIALRDCFKEVVGLLVIYKEETRIERDMYPNVHCSTIYNART